MKSLFFPLYLSFHAHSIQQFLFTVKTIFKLTLVQQDSLSWRYSRLSLLKITAWWLWRSDLEHKVDKLPAHRHSQISLYNVAFSTVMVTYSYNGMIGEDNHEWEGVNIQKEAAVTYLNTLSWHSLWDWGIYKMLIMPRFNASTSKIPVPSVTASWRS